MRMSMINDALEQGRIERKIKVKDFVKDIVSPRSYRRYINSNKEIPANILQKLIDRLGLSLYGFLYGLGGTLLDTNPQEFILLYALMDEHYEKVDNIISSMESPTFNTFLGDVLLPAFMNNFYHFKKQIIQERVKVNVLEYMPISQWINQNFITMETAILLNYFFDYIPSNFYLPLRKWVDQIFEKEVESVFAVRFLGFTNLYTFSFKLDLRLNENEDLLEASAMRHYGMMREGRYDIMLYPFLFTLLNSTLYHEKSQIKRLVDIGLIPSILISKNPEFLIRKVPSNIINQYDPSVTISEVLDYE